MSVKFLFLTSYNLLNPIEPFKLINPFKLMNL
jgi:hypothetical protein